MSRRFLLSLAAALLILCTLAFREFSLQPDGKLHVHFLDVGQGDATLIVSPSGKQTLVDGGPNLSALEHLGKLMPFLDRTIELLVLTHPNADHLTALPEILKRYTVEHVLFSGIAFRQSRYQAILDEVERQGTPVIKTDPEKDIDLGDGVTLDLIWPRAESFGTEADNENNPSVVMRVLYKEHSILLPGDIEEEAEVALLASGQDVRSVVFKAPHHGSKSSSSTGLLLAVKPELAVVSAGKGNRFGHPHQEVLDRFETLGIAVRSTVEEGTISLEFD